MTTTRQRVSNLRRALIRYADIIDVVADDAPRITANARAWAGTLRAVSTDPGRGGGPVIDGMPPPDYADPTGDQAGQLPAYATLEPQLLADLDAVEQAVAKLAHLVLRLDITRRRCVVALDVDAIDEVTETNRRDGLCPTCDHTHCSGLGDDRLRSITVADGKTALMCDPCLSAWRRRPSDDNDEPIDYRTFARGRRRTRVA